MIFRVCLSGTNLSCALSIIESVNFSLVLFLIIRSHLSYSPTKPTLPHGQDSDLDLWAIFNGLGKTFMENQAPGEEENNGPSQYRQRIWSVQTEDPVSIDRGPSQYRQRYMMANHNASHGELAFPALCFLFGCFVGLLCFS